jgi:hypothetical protein
MTGWNVPGYTGLRALGSGGFGDVMLARHDTGHKVEEVICTRVVGVTLTDDHLSILRRLIDQALTWVESRFDQLSAIIKTELESLGASPPLAAIVSRCPRC